MKRVHFSVASIPSLLHKTVSFAQKIQKVVVKQASLPPKVIFDSDHESLWTLLLVNPDGNLEDNNAEYVHWFV